MKRIISIFVSIIMLLQVYAPSFAAGEEQKAVLEAAKEIQKVEEELRKEEKKVSEVVDEINQSVVAIIGKIQSIASKITYIQSSQRTCSMVLAS